MFGLQGKRMHIIIRYNEYARANVKSQRKSPRKRRVKEQLAAGYFSHVWPPRKENVHYNKI